MNWCAIEATRRLVLPMIVAFLVFGCGGESQSSPVAEVSSALAGGQYPLMPWPEDQLTCEPELRIDGMDRDLVNIGGVLVGTDGSMALTQPQDFGIRFFDGEGMDVERVGGEGEGPGEFLMVSRIGWMADTLWAYDQRQSRFSLFAPDRSFVRTLRVVATAATTGGGPRTYLHLYPDGTALAMDTWPSDVREKGTQTFLRVEPSGRVRQTLAMSEMTHVVGRQNPGGGGWSVTIPFSTRPLSDVSPNGDRLVLVHAVFEGEAAGSFVATVVGSAGDTVFANRYPFDLRPIPRAVADSALEAQLERLRRSPAFRRTEEAYRNNVKLPSYYPPVFDVVAGRDGTIWIRIRDCEEGRRYRVIAETGRPIGTLTLSAHQTIAEAERGRLWLYDRNDLGVQSLVRCGIRLGP